MKHVATFLVSAVLVAGCSQELPLQLPPGEPLKLSAHAHGAAVSGCSIAPGSPQYQALEKWLSQNRGGWQTTPASYVPGTVVSGAGFTLNFVGTVVVANVSSGQYSHPTTPTDYGFLQCK